MHDFIAKRIPFDPSAFPGRTAEQLVLIQRGFHAALDLVLAEEHRLNQVHEEPLEVDFGRALTPRDMAERRVVASLIDYLISVGFKPAQVRDGSAAWGATTRREAMEFLFAAKEPVLHVERETPICNRGYWIAFSLGKGRGVIADYSDDSAYGGLFVRAVEQFERDEVEA